MIVYFWLVSRYNHAANFTGSFVAKNLGLAMAFLILLPSYAIIRRKNCFRSS